MNKTNSQGYVSPTGTNMGGHAYVLNGVDTVKKVFRIKNSWGKLWGQQGYAFIRFNDFEKLLSDGGTACIAFENKLTTIPLLERLSPPTSA
jgi:C1A family cysteine protease